MIAKQTVKINTTTKSLLSPNWTMLLLILIAVSFYGLAAATPQPIIYDTDHGPFIDDIFALGLLLNSRDLIDMKVILTTSEQPDLSAICVSAQLFKSEVSGIPVAMGETLPPYEERGGMCAVPGLLKIDMEPECREVYETTEEAGVIEDGVAYAAKLIEESGRDDWWYILVGGQTSLKRLIEEYPEAASKIETLIIMAGNWCSGFDPYPDVSAPTDETVRIHVAQRMHVTFINFVRLILTLFTFLPCSLCFMGILL